MREITIAGRRIADDTPAYVIAEIGHNHGGSGATARQMIAMAAAAGADATKLQKRDVDTLYTPEMLAQPYRSEHSYGPTYGQHRQALELGFQDYLGCRAMAQASQLAFFATAFDEVSADFLMEVDVPAIKLASSSLKDRALLYYVSSLRKPIILSTGGGTIEDIDAAVKCLSTYRTPFALLHCTAAYPVLDPVELNLRAIITMRERYPDTVIGWSGHDPGVSLALVAYAYGARIIEKHVTLNRAGKGTDQAFSLEPKGLAQLCEDLKKAHLASGDGLKRVYLSEKKPLAKMRRQETRAGLQITGSTSSIEVTHARD